MTNVFQLPGAERFSKYLEEMLGQVLTAEGPEIVDRSHNGEYGKRWVIKQGDEQLGEYYTFGPEPGERDFCRHYHGRILGYANELIVIMNKDRTEAEKKPVDVVSLIWANERFEAQDMHEGSGKLIVTPWQRQDGHDKIPFP